MTHTHAPIPETTLAALRALNLPTPALPQPFRVYIYDVTVDELCWTNRDMDTLLATTAWEALSKIYGSAKLQEVGARPFLCRAAEHGLLPMEKAALWHLWGEFWANQAKIADREPWPIVCYEPETPNLDTPPHE